MSKLHERFQTMLFLRVKSILIIRLILCSDFDTKEHAGTMLFGLLAIEI
jgi:hypothetical protein